MDAALAAATVVRGQGARVSVDLSGTSVLEALGVDRVRELIEGLAPETLFGNEDELAVAGELDVPTVVVKRGASGCLVRRGDDVEELPAVPTEVVDTTGAGDALAAGFLLGGPTLGLQAAARCVAVMGAFPP